MKTVIVKTSFWEEEDFNALHIDTKLVYVYILTNSRHGLSRYIKINKQIMSACTGLNVTTIENALGQLKDMKWIDFYASYVVVTKNHVEPKKGRFTAESVEREISEVPRHVLEYFNHNLTVVEDDATTSNSTGIIPVHKDNNKYNIKDIDIDSNKTISAKQPKEKKYTEDDVTVTRLLFSLMKENYPNIVKRDPKESDYEHMNKIHRIDKRDYQTINDVIIWCQQDDFWKANILSVGKLRKHFEKLLISGIQWKQKNESNGAFRI